jgi:hypothetical protein
LHVADRVRRLPDEYIDPLACPVTGVGKIGMLGCPQEVGSMFGLIDQHEDLTQLALPADHQQHEMTAAERIQAQSVEISTYPRRIRATTPGTSTSHRKFARLE